MQSLVVMMMIERLSVCFLSLTTLGLAGLSAQTLIQASDADGVVRLLPGDASVLESREVRKDLPCTVTPVKPALAFDLRFRAGYEVGIPLKELAGSEGLLTMVFRVTPDERKEDAVYLSQHLSVPAIEEDAKGSAYLNGVFELGEGRYHVDFLMRDRGERVCSSYWEIEARLAPKDKQLVLTLAPDSVAAVDQRAFREEPAAESAADGRPLNVKVLVNLAPQNSSSAMLQPFDTDALASTLRLIAREPKIRKFSVVAFNLQQERVVFRQENTDQIDFPALGEALKPGSLGTVNVNQLSQKNGEAQFLAELLGKEMNDSAYHPDAVIIAGLKSTLDQSVPENYLNQLNDVDYPVFYMNVSLDPQTNPWRDVIGRAVKRLKGYEYTISRPRDLWYAWTEIMSRMAKGRVEKSKSAALR